MTVFMYSISIAQCGCEMPGLNRGMFDPGDPCLLAATQLRAQFAGWRIEHAAQQAFPAPRGQLKSFLPLIARKPSIPANDRPSIH